MNLAEDIQKMGAHFVTDYKNRIATLREQFTDTRRMLSEVKPPLKDFHRELRHQTARMRTEMRTAQKQMSEKMHQFLTQSTKQIRAEAKGICENAQKMLQGFHTESTKRGTEAKHCHTAMQSFFHAMAQARKMHPLRGHQTSEHSGAPKAGMRKRHRKAKTA